MDREIFVFGPEDILEKIWLDHSLLEEMGDQCRFVHTISVEEFHDDALVVSIIPENSDDAETLWKLNKFAEEKKCSRNTYIFMEEAVWRRLFPGIWNEQLASCMVIEMKDLTAEMVREAIAHLKRKEIGEE